MIVTYLHPVSNYTNLRLFIHKFTLWDMKLSHRVNTNNFYISQIFTNWISFFDLFPCAI